MPKTMFVCGTDTDVGKTVVSVGILNKLAEQKASTIAMKPIAAGCDENGHNDDALALQAASTKRLPYEQINPIALKEAASPHIAAALEGKHVSVKQLLGFAASLTQQQADYLLVEGAGGWLCPVNEEETLADFATQLAAPVILVVGLRLGCLNHALLSAEAIEAAGLKIQAWVANVVDADMPHKEANIALLKQRISAPCLGVVPWLKDTSQAQAYIDVTSLVK